MRYAVVLCVLSLLLALGRSNAQESPADQFLRLTHEAPASVRLWSGSSPTWFVPSDTAVSDKTQFVEKYVVPLIEDALIPELRFALQEQSPVNLETTSAVGVACSWLNSTDLRIRVIAQLEGNEGTLPTIAATSRVPIPQPSSDMPLEPRTVHRVDFGIWFDANGIASATFVHLGVAPSGAGPRENADSDVRLTQVGLGVRFEPVNDLLGFGYSAALAGPAAGWFARKVAEWLLSKGIEKGFNDLISAAPFKDTTAPVIDISSDYPVSSSGIDFSMRYVASDPSSTNLLQVEPSGLSHVLPSGDLPGLNKLAASNLGGLRRVSSPVLSQRLKRSVYEGRIVVVDMEGNKTLKSFEADFRGGAPPRFRVTE